MKKRLDALLFERGDFESRERARSTIMTGIVYVNCEKADKPGLMVSDNDTVEVRGVSQPFASRGGVKLQKALDDFSFDPKGMTVIDVGASTGGFTDCLLKSGVAKVFAVDVGYGQLAWSIRNDSRVVVKERTNIRFVTPSDIGELADLAVIDVSFISLKLVLPVVRKLLKDEGHLISLIKPQFEATRQQVGKRGIVKDSMVHLEVLNRYIENAQNAGFFLQGMTYAPIGGSENKKNIEFLGYLSCSGQPKPVDVSAVVKNAHDALGG